VKGLGDDPGGTETDEVAADLRLAPVAERGAADLGVVEPRAAA
jgi:hypothetical protein